MRRRKKIWIACAALAVVALLCTSAILYQPVPYRFLEGAHYDGTEVVGRSGLPGGDLAYGYYRVLGTVDSVAERAEAELTPEDGWRVFHNGGDVEIGRAKEGVVIMAPAEPGPTSIERFPHVPGTVYVVVVLGPATPIDRFLAWLHKL